jgi:hypothetical protein
MRPAWRIAAALVVGFVDLGCRAPIRSADCLVMPVSVQALPVDTFVRARMRVVVEDREIPLEVIARSQSEDLVIVGLAPYGLRLFELTQRGESLSVESAVSSEMHRLALFVADALHRVHWIRPRGPSAVWLRSGERINDTRAKGERHREFEREHGPPGSAPVTIRYAAAYGPGAQKIEIDNPWCGYRAVVVILDAMPESAGS